MNNELLSILGKMFSSGFSVGDAVSPAEIESRNIRIDSENFEYQIHLPADAAGRQRLPVIVFLHGIRERGTGALLPNGSAASLILKQYLKAVPAIVLLPRCRSGKYWSDSAMEQMVIGAIEQSVKEFGADANRLYLVGVSMGGYGVWHFAWKYPGKFAALVSICGGSPIMSGERFSPLADRVGTTPAWLFHGAEDRVVPVGESREIVKALKANGGDVRYSEYAGAGHDVWLNALAEKRLMPWLLAQKSSSVYGAK